MGSKSTYALAWLAATVVAATVAWRSLGFIDADADPEPIQLSSSVLDTASTPSSSPTSPSVSVTTGAVETPTTTDGSGTDGSGTVGSGTVSSTTTTTSAAETIDEVFELVGGTAAVRFGPESVEVLWATPAPGFSSETHQEGTVVEVEFKSGEYESKLVAWWDGGPRSSRSEDRED